MIQTNHDMKDNDSCTPIRVTVAPYYNTNVTKDNYERVRSQAESHFFDTVNQLINVLGLTSPRTFRNVGCYTFEDSLPRNTVRELSYTFEFKQDEEIQAELFACLMAEYGYEQQESAIISSYVDNADQANAIEISFNTPEIYMFKKMDGLDDHTYCIENKTFSFYVFDKKTEEEIAQKKQLLASILGCDSKRAHTKHVKSQCLTYEKRLNIYDQWLTSKISTTSLLYPIITEAYYAVNNIENQKLAS